MAAFVVRKDDEKRARDALDIVALVKSWPGSVKDVAGVVHGELEKKATTRREKVLPLSFKQRSNEFSKKLSRQQADSTGSEENRMIARPLVTGDSLNILTTFAEHLFQAAGQSGSTAGESAGPGATGD